MRRISHRAIKKDVFKKKPGVKEAYDALQDEFSLHHELLRARKAAGLTQEQLAVKMHTQKTNISRLESNTYNKPSIGSLRRYAAALNCELKIILVPKKRISRASKS